MTPHFLIHEGTPSPLGLKIEGNRANFSLFSSSAERIFLGLFWDNQCKQIPLNRTGNIWHTEVEGILPGMSYAFQIANIWLADPYAKAPLNFIQTKIENPKPFDWQNIQAPQIPDEELIIYEMHVRGFTKHSSSKVKYPGTYLGMVEKIPYLKKLGINAVELMPIFEFDQNKKPLVNYWGYNPTHFFAPKKWYAALDPVTEFKTLVRELHKNGILVFLDVVYNHTGEGKEKDYYINFRGIDNAAYYLIDPEGNYRDYAGCGNTLHTHHPNVQKMILDSLKYWVEEMHVDGFRFDLASIFTRDSQGEVIGKSPFIEKIVNEPALKRCRLIAESWDAAGVYQVGEFSKWGPFSEWNDRYRDTVRKFIKGACSAAEFTQVLCGSDQIFNKPLQSLNFITAHDGFSLFDLVTYERKYNLANGEEGKDGNDQNWSWNCGFEGPTDDPQIQALRERQMRNFLLALFVSQGIPMLLMGDEYGHTRYGNNNPYVQDNEINWFLWDLPHQKRVEFVAKLIAFRKQQKNLHPKEYLQDKDVHWMTQWDSKTVSFHLLPNLFIAFNAENHSVAIELPSGNWKVVVNTLEDWIFHEHPQKVSSLNLAPFSACILLI